MAQEATIELPDGLLELKAALEAEWPVRQAALRASGVPLNEGDDDKKDEDDETKKGDDKKDADGDLNVDQLKAELKKTREEAARNRVKAREAEARAQAYEDQNKTEAQKLEERAAQAEQRAAAAEQESLRLEVAIAKAPEGMTITQVQKLAKRLSGTNREELEADADELFADFAKDGGDGGSGGASTAGLRPGAAPGAPDPDENDPAKLAEKVRPAYR